MCFSRNQEEHRGCPRTSDSESSLQAASTVPNAAVQDGIETIAAAGLGARSAGPEIACPSDHPHAGQLPPSVAPEAKTENTFTLFPVPDGVFAALFLETNYPLLAKKKHGALLGILSGNCREGS